jgi:hypothetical protein
MTMTPSQALRAPRVPEGPSGRAPARDDTPWPIVETSRLPRASVSDPGNWVRMGQRLAVALIGLIIALGTRPIEALGGIDGDPEDDAPTGDRPDPSAATAA